MICQPVVEGQVSRWLSNSAFRRLLSSFNENEWIWLTFLALHISAGNKPSLPRFFDPLSDSVSCVVENARSASHIDRFTS